MFGIALVWVAGVAGPNFGGLLPGPLRDRADEILREFAIKHHVPGIAYMVVQNGENVIHGEYGVANVETKQPITENSVFPIASLSKPFVALGILSLAEKRQLSLDDPLGTYLPTLPESWKSIPIHRLLDHTSGIPDHYNSGKWDVLSQAPMTSDDLIGKLATLPLAFKAGERYQYSNGNYALLAKIIERVSGEPYDSYLDRKIFRPLGMKRSRVLHRNDLPSVVQGYESVRDKASPISFNPDWCYGNGAIGATTIDLAKLDSGLYTERIVRSSTLQFITTPQPLNDGSLPGYAMGWALGKARGARTVSHNGRLRGWCSNFTRFVDYNLTVIVVSNNGSANLGNLATDLAGTVAPALSLDIGPDDYPDLTATHLAFLNAVMDGKVERNWLSPGLQKDYDSKSQWKGIRDSLSRAGKISAFGPSERLAIGANELRTRYRLEQGDQVRGITIGCDRQGVIDFFFVN